jgi:hypothetical protein
MFFFFEKKILVLLAFFFFFLKHVANGLLMKIDGKINFTPSESPKNNFYHFNFENSRIDLIHNQKNTWANFVFFFYE